MVPPLVSDDLKQLKRHISVKDPRKIFLLFEGENTEPLLINPLCSSNSIIKNSKVTFININKEKESKGITSPKGLVLAANDFINKKILDKSFKKGYDKVMVVFDLDVLNGQQDKMDELVDIKDGDVILCYTNPAVELFILLTKENSYKDIILPNEKAILENKRHIDPTTGKESKHGRRFIHTLVAEHMNINTKSENANFSDILNNIHNAFDQEQFLNRSIYKGSNALTSNIAYVLEKISNDDFDIEY